MLRLTQIRNEAKEFSQSMEELDLQRKKVTTTLPASGKQYAYIMIIAENLK